MLLLRSIRLPLYFQMNSNMLFTSTQSNYDATSLFSSSFTSNWIRTRCFSMLVGSQAIVIEMNHKKMATPSESLNAPAWIGPSVWPTELSPKSNTPLRRFIPAHQDKHNTTIPKAAKLSHPKIQNTRKTAAGATCQIRNLSAPIAILPTMIWPLWQWPPSAHWSSLSIRSSERGS